MGATRHISPMTEMQAPTTAVTIRPAYPDDEAAIRRLAALDSAPVPAWPFLVAEVGGELRAALSLASGGVIADPFHGTVQLVAMLRVYAGPIEPAEQPRRTGQAYRLGRLAFQY